LGLVDFDAIESAWKKILEEEAANAVPNPESDENRKMEKKEKRLSTMQHVLLNTAKVRSLNKSPQVTL
jgi:hypothetical protein